MRNDIINMGLRLLIITVIAGLVLGGTFALTKDAIAEQATIKAEAARREVLPEAESFEQAQSLSDSIAEVYEGFAGGESVGWAMTINADGYGGKASIVLSIGIDGSGAVKAVSIISCGETPGLGANVTEAKFYGQYAGKTDSAQAAVKADGGEIDAVSAATISSRAVSGAVGTALDYYAEHLAGK